MGVTKQPLSKSNAYDNKPTELQKLEILTFTKLVNRNEVTIVAGIKWLTIFLHMCMLLYVLHFMSSLNHKRSKVSQCDPVLLCSVGLRPIFTIRRIKRWIFGATMVYYSFTNTWGYSDSPIKLMPIFLSVGGESTRRKPTQHSCYMLTATFVVLFSQKKSGPSLKWNDINQTLKSYLIIFLLTSFL